MMVTWRVVVRSGYWLPSGVGRLLYFQFVDGEGAVCVAHSMAACFGDGESLLCRPVQTFFEHRSCHLTERSLSVAAPADRALVDHVLKMVLVFCHVALLVAECGEDNRH